MKKLLSITAALGLTFWARFNCQALNLKDAFDSNGYLGKVAGPDGANYNLSQRSVDPIIGNIILMMTSFLSVIFIVLMIYGGFHWMTAAGDDKKVKTAQDTIRAAVIGLIVLLAAYMITYFVFVRVAQPSLVI